MLFLPIAGLLAAKRRLAAHPDPHYHRLARVMQDIPSFAISFIRTVTVGSGFAPDLLTLQACSEERHRRRSRALADLSANKYRRWGIPPRPENAVGPEGHSGPTGGILGGRRSQHGHQGDWTGHPLRMWLGRCLTIHAPPTSVRAEPVEALCSASTGSA